MIIVQKENVQYKVSEKELDKYLQDGFKEIKLEKEKVKEPFAKEEIKLEKKSK